MRFFFYCSLKRVFNYRFNKIMTKVFFYDTRLYINKYIDFYLANKRTVHVQRILYK